MNSPPQKQFIVDRAQDYVPHRKPFLFLDRGEISADQTRAWATRTFTADEPYFAGHFPGDPIVPGVILLELAAQAANLLLSHRAGRTIQGYLVGVHEAKFNAPVRPGQTVIADVRLERAAPSGGGGGGITAFKASVYLEQRRCMRATVQIYQPG